MINYIDKPLQFKYTSANGGHKTVPSLKVYNPLTKEQFAEALRSGFELVEYKKVLKSRSWITIKKQVKDRDIESGKYRYETIKEPVR